MGYTANLSGGKPSSAKKGIWIRRIGTYRYYALTLAGFDPVRADAIWDQPAHLIAMAVMSKMNYEHVEPKKKTP